MIMAGERASGSRIFISYRREDSDIWVARLVDELRKYFPSGQIFQDIASIDPGADFVTALDEALARASAMLVIIGPGWLSATDKQGRRRLDSPTDFVRQEVTESLRRTDVRVFPLLVNGAEMPAEEDLLEPLKPLARRQAFDLTVRHWANDAAQFVEALRRAPGLAEELEAGQGTRREAEGNTRHAAEDRREAARTGLHESTAVARPRASAWKLGAAIAAIAGLGALMLFREVEMPRNSPPASATSQVPSAPQPEQAAPASTPPAPSQVAPPVKQEKSSAAARPPAAVAPAPQPKTPPAAPTARRPEPAQTGPHSTAAANIGGVWRDDDYPSNGSRINQDGDRFSFTRWGILPNGVRFESSGDGKVIGRRISSSYRARYQSGDTSAGHCSGTLSADALRIDLDCRDSLLGVFSGGATRQ